LTLIGEKELPTYMLHYTTQQTTDDRLTDIQTDIGPIARTRKRLLSALSRYFVLAFDSSCYLIVPHLAGCKMQRSAIKLPKILMILVRPLPACSLCQSKVSSHIWPYPYSIHPVCYAVTLRSVTYYKPDM